MGALRTREDYERYQEAFHAGDCDTAFAYMVENPRLSVFGLTITQRNQLGQMYRFLGKYVRETVVLERFAISDDLVAVEELVRVEGLRDLDTQSLREQKMHQFRPIRAGEIKLMRNFVHYHLADGKIESGSCVAAPA
jgi:hypothetical protein